MGKLYDDNFFNEMRKRINNDDFKEKEDLINYLKNLPSKIMSDEILLKKLQTSGIEINSLDFDEMSKKLLEFFDKTKENPASLNLNGVSNVTINDKDYIKVNNADGSHTVLDDNMNKNNFAQQFKDKQNSSYNYQTTNGIKNREQILEEMRKEKEEASLRSSIDVNKRDLTPEEKGEFAAIMRAKNISELNLEVDVERNIYIDKDTGRMYYVHRNSDGQLEVRGANEQTATTVSKNIEYVDQDGNERSITIDNVDDMIVEFEKFDDYELQYIIDNKSDTLTDEQKQAILMIIEKRKQLMQQSVKKNSQVPKLQPKILLKKLQGETYNGFISTLFLSAVTLIYGLAMLLYIFIKCGY